MRRQKRQKSNTGVIAAELSIMVNDPHYATDK